MNSEDGQLDEQLLAAAAMAVVTAFRDGRQREQLPASSLVALRLLETALALYQHSKRAEESSRPAGEEKDRSAGLSPPRPDEG